MPNYKAVYNIYKKAFDDGELDMTPYLNDSIDTNYYRYFLLNYTHRFDVDSWRAEDKFQFAFILSYFHVDYKQYLHEIPDETYFPIRIDFYPDIIPRFLGRSRFTPSFTPLTKRLPFCRFK